MCNDSVVAVCESLSSAKKFTSEFIWAEGAEGNTMTVRSLAIVDGGGWVENSEFVTSIGTVESKDYTCVVSDDGVNSSELVTRFIRN
jgi:hypothetical protein